MLEGIGNNLQRYMDLLSTRQKLVASNIANADTPGYKTKDLDFQFEYLSLTQGAEPNIVDAQGLKTKNDGNNVSMDREARLLSENAIRFNIASTLLKSQIRQLRTAIQDGK
ncbi:MAG TPA: flagellar basal body protein [Bryobacteraceae bacterium]|nr:flagellar basal body protein [Bryobacteraceae bacterium]